MAENAGCCAADVAYQITQAMRDGRLVCDCLWGKLKYANRARFILAAYIPPGETVTTDLNMIQSYDPQVTFMGARAYTVIHFTGTNFTNLKIESSVDGVIMDTAGAWATISLALVELAAGLNGYSADYVANVLTLVTDDAKKLFVRSPASVGYRDSVLTFTITSATDEVVIEAIMLGGLYERTADMNCLTNDQITSLNENVQQICGCNCVDNTNDIVS